jgi:hypothetical protein
MLKIMLCDYNESRHETREEWIRVGERQFLLALAYVDKFKLRMVLMKLCERKALRF